MTCPSCGTDNPASNRFCGSCGTPLAVTCPACGTAATAGQRFCGHCGTPLAPAAVPGAPPGAAVAPPASAAGSGPEMRQVSVLFADLESFTTMSEGRDAEDVRELLSRYFEVSRTVVERYGGTVEKFIGDAVMAVWGSPVAREDDAERAVRAALDVVDAVSGLAESAGIPDLRVRVGVVTGQAASFGSTGEALVVGDRVNTAARVQALAVGNTVLVDDVTRTVTLASIAYSDAGTHLVKGRAEPVHVWRAERVVAGVRGAERVDGLEARFVGRDADLRLVKEVFHVVEQRRSPRLVLVAGAAGVGKSRIFAEFSRYVDGLAADVWWHQGRCLSYGDGVAYWALVEVVRQRLGIPEEAGEALVAERLDEGIAHYVPDPATAAFVRPRLAQLLGVGDETVFDRGDLFAGWRAFFERLAETQPVILALEDLQWADDALLDFLDHLLEWSSASPVFVIGMARPELLDRRTSWAAGRRNVTTLWLDRLPDDAVLALLDDLLPGLPPQTSARIVERAEGVPLYAIETVRSLIDRGVVIAQDGRYRLVREVTDLDVPASLTSLIAARLDGLGADERLLAMRMSVFQGGFSADTAHVVGELDGQRLADALSGLVRKEILAVRSERLSPDRGQYLFAQGLLRQVAYEMLGKRERKARHLAAAAFLSTAHEDGADIAEVLASHYRGAYEALPDDTDAQQIRAQAVEAYAAAGERASSLGAVDLAERAWLSAADLASADQRPGLWLLAARAAETAGRLQDAEDLLARAGADYAEQGRLVDSERAAVARGRVMCLAGRFREAVGVASGSVEALERLGDDEGLARALAELAAAQFGLGDADAAAVSVDRATALAEVLDAEDVLARGLQLRSAMMLNQNRPQEAAVLLAGALATMQLEPVRVMTAYNNLGDLRLQNDRPGAVEHFERCREIARRIGDRGSEALACANLALVELMAGRLDQATRDIDAILRRLEASGVPFLIYQGLLHIFAGTVAAQQGRRDDVDAALQAALPLRESEDPADLGLYEWLGLVRDRMDGSPVADGLAATAEQALALTGSRTEWFRLAYPDALASARLEGRQDLTTRLLRLVEEQPRGAFPPFVRATAARFRGLEAAAEGDLEAAEAALRHAVAELDRMGYPYWASLARLDLAEVLRSTPRAEEADAVEAAARQSLAAMGAGVSAGTRGGASVSR